MPAMRALVLANDFPTSEAPYAGIFVLRQIQALLERGIDVRVISVVPHAPPLGAKWRSYRRIPQRYEVDGIPVEILRAFVPPRMYGINMVARQLAEPLGSLVDEFRPDVVHVHTVVPAASYAAMLRVPTVVTAHGSDAYRHPWRRSDLKNAAVASLRCATSVVCVSEFIRNQVRRLGRTDAVVVYNGADEAIFKPKDRSAARRSLGLPPDRPIVAFAGKIAEAKGVFELIEAARRLGDLHPTVVFAGTGPDSEKLQAAAAGLDARFPGALSHEALAGVFCAADVVALPSYYEGLPAVLCEAMCCGRAIVASGVGGIPEIVRDDETGKIVKPRDVEALGTALRLVLTDAAKRERFEREALAFATDWLTWRHNAAAYEDIYLSSIRAWNRRVAAS